MSCCETADKCERPPLARHLRRDFLRRMWLLFPVVVLMGLGATAFFVIPDKMDEVRRAARELAEGDFLGRLLQNTMDHPSGASLAVVFFALCMSNTLAHLEKSVYRFYAVLPLSRRTRGRMMWRRQAVLIPLIVAGVPVALLAAFSPSDIMLMQAVGTLLIAPSLAAAFLFGGRGVLRQASGPLAMTEMLITVVAVLLAVLVHRAAMLWHLGEQRLSLVVGAAVLAPALFLLVLTYSRAARLGAASAVAVSAPPERRWPFRPEPDAPLTPSAYFVWWTLRNLGVVYPMFLLMGVAARVFNVPEEVDRVFRHMALDAMLAGWCAFSLFVFGGRFVAEQMKVIRALPLTSGKTALAVLAFGVAATAATIPAVALMAQIAVPGRSPMMLAGAVLLGIDAGFLAAAAQVRFGRWAALSNVILVAPFSALMLALSLQIYDQPAIVNPALLPWLLGAFPLCALIGFIALRRAIEHTGANVYRDFFLEKLYPAR